jgi:M6 family metalloprotease-like protein
MFPELTPSSRFRNISECQLKQTFSNYFGTGFGYPRPSFRLKSIGTVKTLLLYVEFTDVKGNDDPIADAQSFIPNFVEFFRSNSYEKLNFVVDTHPNYLPINKSSTSYNMDKWGGGNPFQYWKDGLQAGDSVLDVSKYDLVIVMPPKNITTIIYGPSFPLPPQDSTGRVKNGVIYNGAVGGADQRNAATKWIWLAHEVGHDLGMEHPYSRDGEVIWDLMSNVYNFTAPEFLGWHRLRLDWLDGSNVKCLSSEDLKDSEYNVRLLPIQSKEKGDKLTLVKIDNSKALAIESRRMAGFDTLDGNKNLAGVIVYLVDVSKDSNQNAFSFITGSVKRFASGDRLSGALHVGESLTFDKIKVEFLASDETTDYISLSQ